MRTAELGLVDVLAAGARGAEGVDAQVVLVDLDVGRLLHLRDRRRPRRRRCGGAWLASKGEMRTRRWTPLSALEVAVGVLAVDLEGGVLDAGLLARPGSRACSSRSRCARTSAGTCAAASAAQSWLSVPPAPGWMETMALVASSGPDRKERSSSVSIFCSSAGASAIRSFMVDSSFSASARSSSPRLSWLWPWSDRQSSTNDRAVFSSAMTTRACSGFVPEIGGRHAGLELGDALGSGFRCQR